MAKDLVSILISIHNGESTLRKSIHSILNQTYKNIEVLIIDDGSEDQTYKILEEISKTDNRIKLFKNKENIGLTKSLNLLLNFANGEYVARHDIDDESLSYRIQKQYDYLKKNNLDAVYSRSTVIESGKTIPNLSYYFPKKIVIKLKNPFVHGTLFINKKVLNEIKGYNEDFYYAQDYKLIFDLFERKFKIKIMKDILYKSSFSNNISTLNYEKQKYFAECARKNLKPEINFK